ncbi:MAG: hypothetical protein H0T46_18595 [Deltaproteobacteria bacterium]|nr:hypothetical protein [Deltaproteobacteria bacterium]
MTRERATEGQGGAEAELPTTTDNLDSNRPNASGDVDEVARLLEAQPARRDAILRQLHQSRGNAFVGQVLAAVDNAASHEQRHQDQSPGSFEPDDQGANPDADLLWQGQGSGGGVFSETKNSADTSKKDRRPKSERLAEQSDNATYRAMNTKLKLLAYELHAAGKKLTFDVVLANGAKKQDKAHIEQTDARLSGTIHGLDAMARETARQLNVLRTAPGEPRLEEGGQYLSAAIDEFAPVRAEVDAWMTAHKVDTPSWEVLRRSHGILKLIFPNFGPVAKPLTREEKSSGFQNASISAHLDAAIAAAESAISGNAILHKDRIILHAKELAELLQNQARISGQLEPRIKKLLTLVARVVKAEPWTETTINEAIDPIRNVK